MIYKRPERTPGPIKLQGRSVVVHERMPVDKALRKLKKKLQTDNLMNELRYREYYIKPTQKRKMAKASARKRTLKYVESQKLPKKLDY